VILNQLCYNYSMTIYNLLSSVWSVISYPFCGRCRQEKPGKTASAAQSALNRGGGSTEIVPKIQAAVTSAKEAVSAASSALAQGGGPATAAPKAAIAKLPRGVSTSWVGLRTGRIFSYLGTAYQICDTVGDGACALHAILGDKAANGRYAYLKDIKSGCIARMIYQDTLEKSTSQQIRGKFEHYLACRLEELITNQPQSGENQLLASHAPASKLIQELKLKKERFVAERDKCKSEEKMSAAILETLYSAYARRPEIQDAYFNSCVKSNYFFSDHEISIMADLFNKEIILFGETVKDNPMVFGLGNKERVFIHFGNRHYSRLEIVP